MMITQSRIVAGLFAVVFGASAAMGFGGCGHDLDDCRNTRTCPTPPCMDGGVLEAGDCCKAEDGGNVCEP